MSTDGGGVGIPAVIGTAIDTMCEGRGVEGVMRCVERMTFFRTSYKDGQTVLPGVWRVIERCSISAEGDQRAVQLRGCCRPSAPKWSMGMESSVIRCLGLGSERGESPMRGRLKWV